MRTVSVRVRRTEHGYTLVELLLAAVVCVTMMTIAIPVVTSTIANYRLGAATSSVIGTIQSARYRAIFEGNPLSVTFTQSNSSYVIKRESAIVAGPIPFGSPSVALGSDTTVLFLPSGRLQITQGTTPLSLTYAGKTKKIAISSYGNISVSQ